MSDKEKSDEGRTPRRKRWIIAIALPAVYVLSFGPVVRIAGWLNPSTELMAILQLVVYGPLIWVAERLPWFGAFLDWYVNLI